MAFMCVGNDDDVREVAESPRGALEGLKPGAILVDHTTSSAGLARELEQRARARGLAFLDAPVSGGQAGAVNGRLTVLVGGDEASFRTAEPVLRHYGQAVTLMGPVGSGRRSRRWSIRSSLRASSRASPRFELRRPDGAGLDANQVATVLSKGAAQSWQLEKGAHAPTMIEGKFDFGFAVDWMQQGPRHRPRRSPTQKLVPPGRRARQTQLYQQIESRGGSRWDTSEPHPATRSAMSNGPRRRRST